MAQPSLSSVVDIVDVLATSLDATTGTVLAQTGDNTLEQVDAADAEWWGQLGITARPAPADQGKAATQVVVIRRADHDMIVGSRDVRGQDVYQNLQPGDTCVYALSGQARMFLKANGGIAFVTTADNTANGAAITLRIDPTDGVVLDSPWGRLTFGPAGFHVAHVSGARLDLGGIGGIQIPVLSGIGSYAKISAATVHVAGQVTQLGVGSAFMNVAITPTPLAVPVATTTLVGGSGSVAVAV